jgi:hypothetical protein
MKTVSFTRIYSDEAVIPGSKKCGALEEKGEIGSLSPLYP